MVPNQYANGCESATQVDSGQRSMNRYKDESKMNTQFTNEQQAIIQDTKNHLIVTAVAGSGKTTTIGAKAKYLIENGIHPREIAIITYSRALGDELRSKMPRGVNARTIDSFCYSCLPDLGDTSKRDNIKNFKTHIIDRNVIHHNFSGLKYLFVDESQDLNKERTDVILYLISKLLKLIVVLIGDPYQQIYEGLGSSSKYMMEISDYLTIHSKLKVSQLCLSYNFRSENIQLLEIQTKLLEMTPPIRSGCANQYQQPAIVHYVKAFTLNDDAYVDYIYNLVDTMLKQGINGRDICILNPTGSIRSDKDTASKKLLTTIRSKLEEDFNNNQLYKDLECTHIEIDTVHSMKGKEKDHVIVINVAEATYGFKPDALNLFYVAVSRARHSLHLVVPMLERYRESKFLRAIKDDLAGYTEDLTEHEPELNLHLKNAVTDYISSIPTYRQEEIQELHRLRTRKLIKSFDIVSFQTPQRIEEYGETVAKKIGIRVFYGRFMEKVAICSAFKTSVSTTSLVNDIMGTILIRQTDLKYLTDAPKSLITQARILVGNREIQNTQILDSASGKEMTCDVIKINKIDGKRVKIAEKTRFKISQHYNPSIMFSNFVNIKKTLKELATYLETENHVKIVECCYELARYEQYLDHDWILFVNKMEVGDLLPNPYNSWDQLCNAFQATLGKFQFHSAQDEISLNWKDLIKIFKPELLDLDVDPLKFEFIATSAFVAIPDVIVIDEDGGYEIIDLKCCESEEDVYYINYILQILFYSYLYHKFKLKLKPETLTAHLYSIKTMKLYTYTLEYDEVEKIIGEALKPTFEVIKTWLEAEGKDEKLEEFKKLNITIKPFE